MQRGISFSKSSKKTFTPKAKKDIYKRWMEGRPAQKLAVFYQTSVFNIEEIIREVGVVK